MISGMIGKEIIGKERGKVRVQKLSNVHCLQKDSHDVHHVIPFVGMIEHDHKLLHY